MYYIGLDVHERTISYLREGRGWSRASGRKDRVHPARAEQLDQDTSPTPDDRHGSDDLHWADLDHLLPHAEKVKVAHPLMLRAIAAAKRKNDRIDAGKIADCLRCDFLPECYMTSTAIRDRRRTLRYRNLLLKQMVQMKNRISGLLM